MMPEETKSEPQQGVRPVSAGSRRKAVNVFIYAVIAAVFLGAFLTILAAKPTGRPADVDTFVQLFSLHQFLGELLLVFLLVRVVSHAEYRKFGPFWGVAFFFYAGSLGAGYLVATKGMALQSVEQAFAAAGTIVIAITAWRGHSEARQIRAIALLGIAIFQLYGLFFVLTDGPMLVMGSAFGADVQLALVVALGALLARHHDAVPLPGYIKVAAFVMGLSLVGWGLVGAPMDSLTILASAVVAPALLSLPAQRHLRLHRATALLMLLQGLAMAYWLERPRHVDLAHDLVTIDAAKHMAIFAALLAWAGPGALPMGRRARVLGVIGAHLFVYATWYAGFYGMPRRYSDHLPMFDVPLWIAAIGGALMAGAAVMMARSRFEAAAERPRAF